MPDFFVGFERNTATSKPISPQSSQTSKADYTYNCNAARPPKRKGTIEYWKYDVGSTDLRRSPRNSFRVVGAFLEPPEEGKERTLYLIIMYFKGDKEDVTEEEVADAVAELREMLTQGEFQDEPDLPDPISN